MPEIAEVRHFVDQLFEEFEGQNLNKIEIVGGRFLKEGIADYSENNMPLLDAHFNAKGKFIYWTFNESFSQEETHFFITLGMSGSFGERNKHSAIKFSFDSKDIYFNDIRHFGTFRMGRTKSELIKKLKSLGWDALREPTVPQDLIPKLRKKNFQAIGGILMDQKIFAGLGNYLRSEILYAARINPFIRIIHLTDQDIIRIGEEYIRIAREAYKANGATLATYSDMNGDVGTFTKQLAVYGKKKCPLGYDVVTQPGPDGRAVHWVPKVQQVNDVMNLHRSVDEEFARKYLVKSR